MKTTTQVIKPEWAKQAMLEITVEGSKKAEYIGARKCALFASVAAEIAAFGRTYKEEKTVSRGSVRIGKAGTLVNSAPAAEPSNEDLMAQLAALTATIQGKVANGNGRSVKPVAGK